MVSETLKHQSRQLRLPGLLENLSIRVQEATANQLTHEHFLELLLQDELDRRAHRRIERYKNMARFREFRTLDEFDFSFNKLNRRKVLELATCKFIEKQTDVLLLGPPGVGKSHLIQALGYEAIKRGFKVRYVSIFDILKDIMHDEDRDTHDSVMNAYLKVDLLLLDDMGMKALPPKSGEYLFEIIMRRHERKSTMMTSNRPVEDWGKLIGDVPTATAILDRLLQHAEIIEIKGRSYRLSNRIKDSV